MSDRYLSPALQRQYSGLSAHVLILIKGRHRAVRRRPAQSGTRQGTLPSAALRHRLDATPVCDQQESSRLRYLLHAVVVS